jgi:hypothetical protein
MQLGSGLSALAIGALAMSTTPAQGIAALLVAGAAWITVLTTLNATAQAVLPDWVRGRGLALYLTVFFGAMTLGSAFWGQLATHAGLTVALAAPSSATALIGLAAHRWALPSGEANLTPSMHWPEPVLSADVHAGGGPVMVRIHYVVPPADHARFRDAIRPLGRIRRRDGAYAWGVMIDVERPDRVMEWFLVASWEAHLRQHHRVSHADRRVQEAVNAFHRDLAAPRVEHSIALRA